MISKRCNTFHCLSRKCSTKLIKLFDFFMRVLLVTQNCLQWKLCWACSFLNTHHHSRERPIKFGGHLGGFGADMFEAEINKLKEKSRTLSLPSRSLTIEQVIKKQELMCRKVTYWSKAELASLLNQCDEGRLAISVWTLLTCSFC